MGVASINKLWRWLNVKALALRVTSAYSSDIDNAPEGTMRAAYEVHNPSFNDMRLEQQIEHGIQRLVRPALSMSQQHKLEMSGPPGSLAACVWRCSCGKWESKTPDVGPYGRRTAKARIAQVKMAHGKHVKGATP